MRIMGYGQKARIRAERFSNRLRDTPRNPAKSGVLPSAPNGGTERRNSMSFSD